MDKPKPSRLSEGNESNISTDRNKGKSSKPKKYRDNKPQNKPSPEPKTDTEFQGRFTDLECYTFYLGPRASETFARKMKDLERCLGVTYIYVCQPAIMTETVATFPDPEMSTITDLVTERPKIDGCMTYLGGK